MASPNESNPQSGNDEVKGSNSESGPVPGGMSDVSAKDKPPAPFSEFDPFRSARFNEIYRETDKLLGPLQIEYDGIEGASEAQLRQFYEDAAERASWSEARQDAFTSILRFHKPIPSRSERIL